MNMPNADYWTDLSRDDDFRRARAHIVMLLSGRYGVLVFLPLGELPRRLTFPTRVEAELCANTYNGLVNGTGFPEHARSVRGFS